MVHWSPNFPAYKYPLGYARILAAILRRKSRIGIKWTKTGPRPSGVPGDCEKLERLRNKYAGKRCFILGNGPSLQRADLTLLKNEICIGSNGLYRLFNERNFSTDFLLFEDIEQTEIHGNAIKNIDGPTKIAATHNAHAIARPWKNLIFMNARLADDYYWNEMGVQFSLDFPNIVYLGSTVTYIGLQLAFHLGFKEVYLIGMNFDYGPIAKGQKPGKITLSEKNIDLVSQSHFNGQYYKKGQVIGIPDYGLQTEAFKKAKSTFEAYDRKIFNATIGGKLEIFDRVDYESLFKK